MQRISPPHPSYVDNIIHAHQQGLSEGEICSSYDIPLPLIRQTIIDYELEKHNIEMD